MATYKRILLKLSGESLMGEKLYEGMKELVKKYGKPWKVNHIGSLGCIYFTDQDVENYEDAKTSDTEEFARYFHYMLEHGIHLGPSQFEAMFLSLSLIHI